MESQINYILQLAIILLAANLGGLLLKKLKQPEVLGQILVGVLVGLFSLGNDNLIPKFAQLGVIFLMFMAGLETDIKELKECSKSASFIAMGGVIFPIIFVTGGVYVLHGNLDEAIFMGVIATATSVSISVQTLREMSKLGTKQGISILGAAIIDDVVGIILLTFVIAIIKPSEDTHIVMTIIKIVSFFIISIVLGITINKVLKFLQGKVNVEKHIVVTSIIICLSLSFLSEELGVAAITGAYFTGVMFSATDFKHKITYDINNIASVLFTPIFFVSIGMNVDLKLAFTSIRAGALFILLAIVGKFIGAFLGAKTSKFSKREAMQIGLGMVPRAEVAIIIATLGVQMEIIGDKELAAVILMVLVTTIITPPMLKASFNRDLKTND